MILYSLLAIVVQGQCLDLTTAHPDGAWMVLYFVDNIRVWVPSQLFLFFHLGFAFLPPHARTAPERKEEGENFEESLVNHWLVLCWDHLHY